MYSLCHHRCDSYNDSQCTLETDFKQMLPKLLPSLKPTVPIDRKRTFTHNDGHKGQVDMDISLLLNHQLELFVAFSCDPKHTSHIHAMLNECSHLTDLEKSEAYFKGMHVRLLPSLRLDLFPVVSGDPTHSSHIPTLLHESSFNTDLNETEANLKGI